MHKKIIIALMSGLLLIPTSIYASSKVRYSAGAGSVIDGDVTTVADAKSAASEESVEEDSEEVSSSESSEEDSSVESVEKASESESSSEEEASSEAEEEAVLAEEIGAGAGSSKSIKTIAEEVEEKAAAEKDDLAGFDNLGIAKVADNLNVRETAEDDGEVVGKMRKNAACEIIETKDGWSHIKSGSVEGYVKADYLLTGDEARAKAEEVKTIVAKVNTTTLFVRGEASADSECLTMVPMDEELEITEGEEGDEWIKVAIDDDEGWVKAEYVNFETKLEKALSTAELKYGQGVSELRVNLVNFSKKFLGNPYVWGGTSLTHGADCSGYVQSVFRNFGISLPRTSREQARCGTSISASEAKPGDLFFYAKYGRINHVAIYIGGGQVINASSPKTGIKISNAYYRKPAAVRRIISE
ncbi:MAG: C40 family peptidase [Lachnospiraceae bacterium]|nr:C40 family peptidase [Lachnospiraceae bacterium]